MTYERITVEPGKMGGVACIRGLRIPVATVADAPLVAERLVTAGHDAVHTEALGLARADDGMAMCALR